MYYFIETYEPKEAWTELPVKERIEFFQKISQGLALIEKEGIHIEPFKFGISLPSGTNTIKEHFVAIWRAEKYEDLRVFADAISESGWHDYFDTSNAIFNAVNLEQHLEDLRSF